MLGHLLLEALFGARLDLGAGLGKLHQALFAPRQFVGDRHAVDRFSLIRSFRPRQQFGHFGLQLGLDLAGVLIRQRAVSAGIGVDFRAVQSHRTHLEQAHLARQFQHPHEQAFDLFEKASPKCRDGVVVGMLVAGNETERH